MLMVVDDTPGPTSETELPAGPPPPETYDGPAGPVDATPAGPLPDAGAIPPGVVPFGWVLARAASGPPSPPAAPLPPVASRLDRDAWTVDPHAAARSDRTTPATT